MQLNRTLQTTLADTAILNSPAFYRAGIRTALPVK
jgi:hypothetical protein